MGCKNCSSKNNSEDSLYLRIIDYIQRDDISNIESLLKLQSHAENKNISTLLDSPFLPINNLKLSPLSLSVYLGSSEVFYYLHYKLKASSKKMHKNLNDYNLSPLTLICEKGFLSLLKLYLPIYLESLEWSCQYSVASFSNNHLSEKVLPAGLPLQAACKGNYLNILQYVHSYFSSVSPPVVLDIHAVDRSTGENCALISVRTGNFVMMKMLFEVMQADFHITNNEDEGALQILAASAKSGCSIGYYECAMYLVDVIRVDVAYQYQKTFEILENFTIRLFLEDKCRSLGINVDECRKRETYQNYRQNVDTRSFTKHFKDLSSILKDSSESGFSGSIY